MDRPFDWLRVIDLSETIAGQYCARLLGAYGAEVILLEPPAGSAIRRMPPYRPGTDESLLFTHLNAGKRSVIAAPDTFARLAGTADVILVGPDGGGPELSRAHPRGVPRAELPEATLALAARIARHDFFALRMAKLSVNEMQDLQGQRQALQTAFKNYMMTIPHRKEVGTFGEAVAELSATERIARNKTRT